MPQSSLFAYFAPPGLKQPDTSVSAQGAAASFQQASTEEIRDEGTIQHDTGDDDIRSRMTSDPVKFPPTVGTTIGTKTDHSLSARSLHVSIVKVQTAHIAAIKRLTATLLPVRYPDSFFAGTVEDPVASDLSRVVVFDSKPIGWIRCRLDPFPNDSVVSNGPCAQIYLQALCLLAPYRGQGIAIELLESVLRHEILDQYGVASVAAHVWENNEEALQWYEKRGFQKLMMVDQYYRRLRPPGAWVMRKNLI